MISLGTTLWVFCQILLTNSLKKCREISYSPGNFYVRIIGRRFKGKINKLSSDYRESVDHNFVSKNSFLNAKCG